MEKFLKFGLVGLINTLITMIVFNILRIFGVGILVANTIGYICGMANSYLWNNKWVFKANSKDISTIGKFIIVNVITMLINNGILIVLVNNIKLNATIAQALALIITTVINFIGNKIWTFNE